MSEARIWSVVRSASQIQNNMTQVSPKSVGLEAYWRFNEGQGNVFEDATGQRSYFDYFCYSYHGLTVFYLQIRLLNGNSNKFNRICTYEKYISITINSNSNSACLSHSFRPVAMMKTFFNEWNATYVSLQRNDYLSGDVKKFNLTHDANGIEEMKLRWLLL